MKCDWKLRIDGHTYIVRSPPRSQGISTPHFNSVPFLFTQSIQFIVYLLDDLTLTMDVIRLVGGEHVEISEEHPTYQKVRAMFEERAKNQTTMSLNEYYEWAEDMGLTHDQVVH